MKVRKVIKNTPPKLPLSYTLLTYLLLDRFNAPEWLWGSFGVLFAIVWVIQIIDIWNCERIDIFESSTKIKGETKKSFQDKIKDIQPSK